MKFEVLKRNNLKKNIIIGIITVGIISAIILNFTRAKYKVTQSIPLVNGTINYSLADIEIVELYINGEKATELDDNTKYTLDTTKSTCIYKNGSSINNLNLNYDSETKTFTISPYTTKGTKCTLYFDILKDASSTIEELYPNNQLAYDDFNNLRYIGANPDNYVYFNCEDYNNPSENTCELWRIIGIFNEDTHGISGKKLVKLIRNELIEDIAYDSNTTNDWSKASLQTSLNEAYLEGESLQTGKGINPKTKNMIETVIWKLGGTSTYSSTSNGLASHFYNNERSTKVYNGRPTTWSGKIALLYISDYGYATSGGSTKNRSECLAKELLNWNSSSFSDCKNNDWLSISNNSQWTLDPVLNQPSFAFRFNGSGSVDSYSPTYYTYTIRPSLYLKSNISITSGDGTLNNPYTLK